MATCAGCGTPPVPPICTPSVTDTPVFFRPVGAHTPVPGFIRTTVAADCTQTLQHLDQSLVAFSELQPIVDVQYYASVSPSTGTGGPVNWSDILDRVTAPIASQNTSVANALAGKQPTLVSGNNLKTLNGQSLLGPGNLVVTGGGTSYPEALNFSALPGSSTEGDTYVVLQPQGIYLVNRKPAGLYRYTSSQWVYLGEVPDGYFTDNVLRFFDNADLTKQVAFELGGITSGQTRTLTVPDASGTVALTSDPRFTDTREPSTATVPQVDAEAGTSTSRFMWTPQRVWQAITKALGGVTVTNTPATGQVLKATGTTTAAWGTDDTGGGVGGSTDLSWSPSPTGGTVASSSGADASLTLADGTNAGLMAPAQHTKLAGLATVATSGAYGDLSGRPTLGTAAATDATAYATAAQGTDSREWTAATVDQAEAEAGTATTRRAWTAQRVAQAIAAQVAAWWTALTVGPSKITMSTARLLGRSTAGTGAAEEIAIGSGLSLSGGTLSATGGGGGGGAYEVADWAALQALSGVPDGRVYTVLAPLVTGGQPGTEWVRSGSVWRPNGRQTIYRSNTPVDAAASTSEQLLLSLQLPAGLLLGVSELGCRALWLRLGGSNWIDTPRWRLGSAGSSSDALLNATGGIAAFFWGYNHPLNVLVRNSTTVVIAYANNTGTQQIAPETPRTYDNSIATVTVPDMSGALYLSASIQRGGTTSGVSLNAAVVFVE